MRLYIKTCIKTLEYNETEEFSGLLKTQIFLQNENVFLKLHKTGILPL